MAGWVVDIWVEWIVRMIAKLVQRVRSRSWPVVQASVTQALCERAGYGCDVADVRFKYEYEGQSYTGLHREPFIMHALGGDYCLDHPAGSEARVRVKPGDPETTVFLGN